MIARLPFAPVVAVLFGLVALILVVATPHWLFERVVEASGLPGLLSAANPPLGEKARIAASLAAGLGTGLATWILLSLPALFKKREGARSYDRDPEWDVDADNAEASVGPRRRRPIFAERDLGAPFMSDQAMEQAREELVLVTPKEETRAEPEVVSPAASFDAIEDGSESGEATPDAEPAMEPETATEWPIVPETASAGATVSQLRPVAQESIPALLDRLEAAMTRRQGRGLAPLADIASLRNALNGGRSRR